MGTAVREESFVVFGLGTFGSQTARALYRGGAIVLAIDRDTKIVDQISPFVTVANAADATDEEVLQEVGAFDMTTAIVALRRYFDITVLVTHMLRQRGFRRIFVQVDSEKEASAILAVGATSVIFPERDMAEEIARKLLTPGLADQVPLAENFAIIDVPCPKSFVGRTLQELDIRRKYRVMVIATKGPASGKKKENVFQMAPPPDIPLDAASHLILLGERKSLFNFKELFQLES